VEIGALFHELRSLSSLCNSIEGDESRNKEIRVTARNTARLAQAAADHIDEAVSQSDTAKVYWIELDDRNRSRLKAKPIDVSGLLRKELFDHTESVTLVSATLATGKSFEFTRRELGVPDNALELIAESPFDFRSQALLVAPEKLPDPREPEFPNAAAWAFKRVVDLCGGRTLGLFTSYRVLDHVHQKIKDDGYRILKQGEMPRTELTRIFKEDIRSVLLGTDSFWTGVDVPGEALTGLVIDKLPFPHPDDPVVSAICERDKEAFNNYLVPKAIITLRQGVGRLIRSQKDIGVVVILDTRIVDKRYGRRFLASLPPMFSTRRLENISRFLKEAEHARVR
jgi:ATP-dependent DNA helicase DinG